MNRTRTIIAAIGAVLLVILAGTPASASAPVGEAENIVYGNRVQQEIWSVVIFNAGSPTVARSMYRETDRAFIVEHTSDLYTSVARGQVVDADTLDIMGADAATFYSVTSELGDGAVIVAYAGDYLYMFSVIGMDDFEDFAGWQIEVIAAETFVGVDVPRGFIAVED